MAASSHRVTAPHLSTAAPFPCATASGRFGDRRGPRRVPPGQRRSTGAAIRRSKMFKLINMVMRALRGDARVEPVRLGDQPFEAHIEAWWDVQDALEGARGYAAWAQERAEI